MVDACSYNQLSCNALDDITYTVAADGTYDPASVDSDNYQTQSTLSCTWSGVDNGGNTLTDTECPVTQELQYFNEATNAWAANTDQMHPDNANPCYYANHADGTNPCVYKYQFTNAASAYNTFVDPVRMRWKVVDARSQMDGGTDYVEWDRTILWQCYEDQMTISSGGHPDFTIVINNGSGSPASTTASTTETQTWSACAHTYAC